MNVPTTSWVWIILLNWRNGQDTVECLDSILNAARSEVAGVVICDNASGDDSVDRCRAWAGSRQLTLPEYQWRNGVFHSVSNSSFDENVRSELEIVLIHTGANRGFAAGNNIGIEFVRQHRPYDFLLLLNNDALLTTSAARKMAERFNKADRIGMCGCTVIYHHTPSEVQALGGASFNKWFCRSKHIGAHSPVTNLRPQHDVEARLHYILGAALMISRACIDDVGVMTESYFLYYEELDWATRVTKAGYSLGYVPDAEVLHKEGRTIGSSANKQKRSLLSEYYLYRGRIPFTLKFYPYCLPTVLAFALLQSFRPVFIGDFRRAQVRLAGLLHLPSKYRIR